MKEYKVRTARQLANSNKKFNAMSPKEKRVAVAKDALKQIRYGRYKANTGNYVIPNWYPYNVEDNEESQEYLENKGFWGCKVCAIGAVFLSKVRLGNNHTGDLEVMNSPNMIISNLKGIFSAKQLRLMEVAFEDLTGGAFKESSVYDSNNPKHTAKIEKALEFFKDYLDRPEERLIAILENIIANNGTFKP
jgi:hypothetical protein